MVDKFVQFKKFILFFEEFNFISTLYEFLNEKNKLEFDFNNYPQFKISYTEFKVNFLRKLENYARNSCGIVCQSDNSCDGHRALTYLQRYEQFMIHMVEEEKIFYKNILIMKDGKNTDPLMGYIFIPTDMVDLKDKSWSQRLAMLN